MNPNKRIIHVLIVISAMFLALVTYLLYFNMFEASKIISNPYNMRQWDSELYTKRGTIYDKNGIVLAKSEENSDGVMTRNYPKGHLYSHVIGYHSRLYGKNLLEKEYDEILLGKKDMAITFGDVKSGFDLNLTIDNDLQEYTYEQLKGKKGAIVAMDPKSGAILAMVSLPDFDPNPSALEKSWKDTVESEESPLMARAVQGLYPPGSTFKIVTAAAAYEQNRNNETFNDVGKFEKGSVVVDNYAKKAYGQISMEKGFEVSSNQVFCTLGYEMGADVMKEIAERFGIDKDLKFDIKTSKSTIQYKKMVDIDSALVAIGQGQLLVTPLEMAIISSTVANDGVMMKPYVVGSIGRSNGVVVQRTKAQQLGTIISPSCAQYMKELMTGVVKRGTGTKAAISGIDVAGKTGTAENETKNAHSWFVGFAPADEPEIAIAVILENDGSSGGTSAAPIARNVMKKYLVN